MLAKTNVVLGILNIVLFVINYNLNNLLIGIICISLGMYFWEKN